jgi:hypothetical protein
VARKVPKEKLDAARRRAASLKAEARLAVERARRVIDEIRNAAQLRVNRRALNKKASDKK